MPGAGDPENAAERRQWVEACPDGAARDRGVYEGKGGGESS